MESHVWSRRRVLSTAGRVGLAGLGAGLGAGLVAGCGDGHHHTDAASAAPAVTAPAGPRTVMIIRHGEKPDGSSQPYGITADGVRDDESLTTRGWARAGALTALFAPSSGGVRTGLAVPTAVLAASPGAHGSKRPAQTVSDLAARLGLDVDSSLSKSDVAGVAKQAAAHTGPVLICWQHEEIPAIAERFGVRPPSSWPGDRYDLVWVLRPSTGRTWSLDQVPQLLLAGDSASPIAS